MLRASRAEGGVKTGRRRWSRSDNDEDSGDQNDEKLLQRSEVRDTGCMDDKGKECAAVFDSKSLK